MNKVSYGAQEDDRMATPESGLVEWIGYDKTKTNGIAMTVSCMAKTWFEARLKIDLQLHPVSLGDLKVVRGTLGGAVAVDMIVIKEE